jgi:hypothetical protein
MPELSLAWGELIGLRISGAEKVFLILLKL